MIIYNIIQWINEIIIIILYLIFIMLAQFISLFFYCKFMGQL